MHILPVSIAYQGNKNNIKHLSFGASFVLPSNATFADDKNDIFNFSKRYKEIKKFNPEKAAAIKMLGLDNESYNMAMKAIYQFPQRKTALLNKKAGIKLSNSKDTFNGITDKKLALSFSNGYGFYSMIKTSNNAGNLHVSRETSGMEGKTTTNFIDTSRFNEEYYVENSYKKTIYHSNGYRTAASRNISVTDYDFNPVLEYSYSKKDFKGYSEFNINGRIYRVKVNNDAQAAITSGSRGELLDFSDTLAFIPEIKQETFVEALKLLPPQILLELKDTLDYLSLKNSNKKEVPISLFSPSVAANEMIDYTIERLSDKHFLAQNKELDEIFQYERKNFTNWLETQSDEHLRKTPDFYLKKNLTPDKEILEVIKAVCNLLWMEEYEDNSANDEHMCILLNFFPETVNFIISQFELNKAKAA